MEASGPERARPQHRHPCCADCAQPDARDADLHEARPRQRREAGRDFGDHHASRLLFRLGERDGAAAAAKDVFAERKLGVDQLPAASPSLLPLNEAAEADRAKRVGEQFGAAFPSVVQDTTDVLFRDLWLRPDLAPRDRSLVTVSALIASGQVAQIPYHLNRAMDNGLTQTEAAEAMSHLAYYVGWPNVFSAMPVAKEVFEKRSK